MPCSSNQLLFNWLKLMGMRFIHIDCRCILPKHFLFCPHHIIKWNHMDSNAVMHPHILKCFALFHRQQILCKLWSFGVVLQAMMRHLVDSAPSVSGSSSNLKLLTIWRTSFLWNSSRPETPIMLSASTASTTSSVKPIWLASMKKVISWAAVNTIVRVNMSDKLTRLAMQQKQRSKELWVSSRQQEHQEADCVITNIRNGEERSSQWNDYTLVSN